MKNIQAGIEKITPSESQENAHNDDVSELALCVICQKNEATVESPGGDKYCADCGVCKRCGGSVAKFVRHEDYTRFLCPCAVKMNKTIKKEDEARKIAKMRQKEALLRMKW